jgi:hypothetical protein
MTFERVTQATLRDGVGAMFSPGGVLRISLNGGADEVFLSHKTHCELIDAATAELRGTAAEHERIAGERQQEINRMGDLLTTTERERDELRDELDRIRNLPVGAGMSAAEIRKMDPCVLEAEWAAASEAAPFRDSEPLRYCLILREALARRAEREVIWAGMVKPLATAAEAVGNWPAPIGDLTQCRREYARVVAELDKIKRHPIASGKTADEIRGIPGEVFADEAREISQALGSFNLAHFAREVLARRAEREAAATIYAPPVDRSSAEWTLRDALNEILERADAALEETADTMSSPRPSKAAPGEPA